MSGQLPQCRGCGTQLESGNHLRTQLAPAKSKWHEVRTCDLTCLLDFLEQEEDKVLEGKPTSIAWAPARRG